MTGRPGGRTTSCSIGDSCRPGHIITAIAAPGRALGDLQLAWTLRRNRARARRLPRSGLHIDRRWTFSTFTFSAILPHQDFQRQWKNTRAPAPPSPPAEDDDWPYGDGIPNNEVEADMRAIEQAECFWATYSDPGTRNEKYKVRFRDTLAKHIARLEEMWETVASYNADNFSYTSRKSTMDAKLRNPELLSLWEELIAEQEAKTRTTTLWNRSIRWSRSFVGLH